MSEGWARLDEKREINHSLTVPVVRPIVHEKIVPLDCPVCGNMLRDHTDVVSYENFGCCDPCSLQWAQPNREKWSDGWRPSPADVEMFLDSLKKLPTYIVR